MEQINSLLEAILKIPGQKIVTLATAFDQSAVDIDENGKFGYEEGVKEFFIAKLLRAINEGGGLIIREFLPFKIKRKSFKGKDIWIPEKALYGVFLKDGKWSGLSALSVEKMFSFDSKTKQNLEPEEGVHFRDFPYCPTSL